MKRPRHRPRAAAPPPRRPHRRRMSARAAQQAAAAAAALPRLPRRGGSPVRAAAAPRAACSDSWRCIAVPHDELLLKHTLPVGQSFRWRQVARVSAPLPDQPLDGEACYAGVIGRRIVELVQLPPGARFVETPLAGGGVLFRCHGPGADGGAGDAAALCDYLNLAPNDASAELITPTPAPLSIAAESVKWSKADERYRNVAKYIGGARVLRQPPVECLFSFICSSNNNIERITGMVQSLCEMYGEPLGTIPYPDGAHPEPVPSGSHAWYAFPTLDELRAKVTDEDLRARSFGYRAKFIVKAATELHGLGGEAWLLGLRDQGASHTAIAARKRDAGAGGGAMTYEDVLMSLTQITGIGRKVSACVCLFALDQHRAIPVDTHVWQIAVKYYYSWLDGKSVTPKNDRLVQDLFHEKFGDYCGWAHNALFIAELSKKAKELPKELRTPPKRRRSDAGGGGDAPEREASPQKKKAAKATAKAATKAAKATAKAPTKAPLPPPPPPPPPPPARE